MSGTSRVVSGLMTLLGVDPAECVSPDDVGATVRQLVSDHDLNVVEFLDPVEAIHEMRDDPDSVYVWTLAPDATGEDMQRLGERIHDACGGDPRALHMFIRDLDELQKFDYTEIEHEILPWLVQAKHRNGDVE